MVSIAESFYYRIFERKWRMGEAFRGPSPCMPYSVSNKYKTSNQKNKGGVSLSTFFFCIAKIKRVRVQAWLGGFLLPGVAVWLGVCCARENARPSKRRVPFFALQPRGWRSQTFCGSHKKKKNIALSFFFLISHNSIFFCLQT